MRWPGNGSTILWPSSSRNTGSRPSCVSEGLSGSQARQGPESEAAGARAREAACSPSAARQLKRRSRWNVDSTGILCAPSVFYVKDRDLSPQPRVRAPGPTEHPDLVAESDSDPSDSGRRDARHAVREHCGRAPPLEWWPCHRQSWRHERRPDLEDADGSETIRVHRLVRR